MATETSRNVQEERLGRPRPPSPPIVMPPSFDALITKLDAYTQEVGKAVKEMARAVDRETRHPSRRGLPSETRDAARQMLADIIPISSAAGGEGRQVISQASIPGGMGVTPGEMQQRRRQVIRSGVNEPAVPQSRIPMGWEAGRRYGLKDIYGGVQQAIGRHASEYGAGRMMRMPNPFTGGDAGPIGIVAGRNGGMLSAAEAQHATRMASTIRGIGGEMAEGRGLMAGIEAVLPEGALGALGIAGAGVTAANEIANFATNQRSVNAGWQAIQGGSNRDAFGERARSQLFEWSQKGVLGAGDASKLYRGIAETGIRDRGTRSHLADFGVEEYKKLGMSIDDSMKVIQYASSTGQESLRGVADALDQVTKAAVAGGTNAKQARDDFLSLAQTLSTTMVGSTATGVSAAVTGSKNLLGREFAGADFSGALTDPALQALQAREMGMTLPQYQGIIAKGGQAGQRAAVGGAQIMVEKATATFLRPRGEAIVDAWRQKNKPMANGQFDPEALHQLSAQLQTAGINPNVASQMLLKFGVHVDPSQADEFLASVYLGQRSVERGDKNPEGYDPAGVLQSQIASSRHGHVGDRDPRTGKLKTDLSVGGGIFGVAGKRGHALSQYGHAAEKTGITSPIIQKFLDKNYDPKSRFKIKVKGGYQEMDFGQAMRQAPDQMESGTVEIIAGRDKNKTISEATGMETDEKMKITSAGKKAEGGEHFGKWQADQDKKAANTSVVRIEATPWLQKLLKITPTPVSPHSALTQGPTSTLPDSRPAGNP